MSQAQATLSHPAQRAGHVSTPARKILSVRSPSTVRSVTTDNPSAVDSHRLLQGMPYVNILHNGQIYQLRATRYGKLILTK